MASERRLPGSPPFWQPGQQVLMTYGDVTGPHWANPVTVVRDDESALVMWLRAGTPVLRPERADGLGFREDPETMFTAERVQGRATWTDNDVVWVVPTGRPWAVGVFFDAGDREFLGWYVNIEEPHTRDAGATYSTDHVLDIWVEPDRTHSRKDEDELVEAVRQGRYTAAEADRITGIAAEVEALIDAWASPFCDGWERFTPDPSWPIPSPPDGG